VARKDADGNDQLIAYVARAPGASPSSSALRIYLRELVPEHMVPVAFVMLDQLPVLESSKVDQLALPPPGPMTGQSEVPFVAPRSMVEKTVAGIWQDVLGIPGVGLHDRFLDLGGNSLKAMQIISRLQVALGVALPMEPLLNTATMEQQAAAIEKHLSSHIDENIDRQFLVELEAMSEEEAQRLLAAQGQVIDPPIRRKRTHPDDVDK
jgi:acyl carrier protein